MNLIYITNPDRKTSKKIALHLLKKRLIACSNIFPVESVYLWKGKIEKTKEFVLIVKTLKRNFEKVKNEIKKIRPYTVPCIIKINAGQIKSTRNG